jgi:signal peptidase I
MFPTFQDGDLLLKEGITWRYFRRPFRVGDVIVYRSPFNRSEYFVKRIVALVLEITTINTLSLCHISLCDLTTQTVVSKAA